MEWLSQNWYWLVFAVGMVLMLRRGGGGCCGGGRHEEGNMHPEGEGTPPKNTLGIGERHQH